MVGSMDVEALYPSIHQQEGARIVAEEIVKSDIEYEGADIRKAAVYIAATMSKERQKKEGILHLLPIRKSQGKSGRRPTVRSRELGGPLPRPSKPETDLDPEEDLPGFEEGGSVIGKVTEEADKSGAVIPLGSSNSKLVSQKIVLP